MVKKTNFNAKVTEAEGKIPSISGLATSSALTAVENKIPDTSSLIKKTDYDTKCSDIERKIIDNDLTNILLLQNLILWLQAFLMQD